MRNCCPFYNDLLAERLDGVGYRGDVCTGAGGEGGWQRGGQARDVVAELSGLLSVGRADLGVHQQPVSERRNVSHHLVKGHC